MHIDRIRKGLSANFQQSIAVIGMEKRFRLQTSPDLNDGRGRLRKLFSFDLNFQVMLSLFFVIIEYNMIFAINPGEAGDTSGIVVK